MSRSYPIELTCVEDDNGKQAWQLAVKGHYVGPVWRPKGRQAPFEALPKVLQGIVEDAQEETLGFS